MRTADQHRMYFELRAMTDVQSRSALPMGAEHSKFDLESIEVQTCSLSVYALTLSRASYVVAPL